LTPKVQHINAGAVAVATNDIREAIRPLAEFLAERKGERPARQARKPKAKKKEYPPAAIPIGAKLLRLPAPGKPPRAERPKYFPQGVPHNAAQITYSYSRYSKSSAV
jgi:putative DNA primase/helicase